MDTLHRLWLQIQVYLSKFVLSSRYGRSEPAVTDRERSVAVADPPAAAQARVSAREDLAPATGDRCGDREKQRLRPARERRRPGGLRMDSEGGHRRRWRGPDLGCPPRGRAVG